MTDVAVVLAAGQGTRMKSPLPKVLHRVAGRPMVSWVLDAVDRAGVDRVMVVVGHQAEQVRLVLPDDVETCLQDRQLGTGHAARVALDALDGLSDDDTVVVLAGDTPLITGATLASLVRRHRQSGAVVTLLTTEVDDPTGYGRVVRKPDGSVEAIVEEKDADEATRRVREINAGMYAFRLGTVDHDLDELRPDNAQGEYYLTDVVGMAVRRGDRVEAVLTTPEEASGVNDPAQLAWAEGVLGRRLDVGFDEPGDLPNTSPDA